MNRWLCTLALFRLVVAGENDYRVENNGWNGLSELAALARSRAVVVASPSRLDLAQVDTRRDAILVMHPKGGASASGSQLVHFVTQGGTLIVADDFGDSDAIFAKFGAERVSDVSVGAEDYLRGNPQLPVALPWGSHELTAGVDRVILNHPAALRARHKPVLGAGMPIVVVGQLGSGRFLLCSDPSMFINNMLEQPGNFAFAQNMLDWLLEGRGRVFVLSQEFVILGEVPTQTGAEVRSMWEMGRLRSAFNAFLAGFAQYVPLGSTVRGLGVIAALGVFMFLRRAS